MDEITRFAELAPSPPGETAEMLARARARLDAGLAGGPAPAGTGAATGRPRHRRRLVLGMAVATAATAAIVAPLVASSGGTTAFATAAYSVKPQPDDSVTVTINQARDPAGLQRALRADGIPAYVRYVPIIENPKGPVTSYPACTYISPPGPRWWYDKAINEVFSFPPARDIGSIEFIIHPRAIPPGAGVFVEVDWVPQAEQHGLRIKDNAVGTGFTLIPGGKLGRCVPGR